MFPWRSVFVLIASTLQFLCRFLHHIDAAFVMLVIMPHLHQSQVMLLPATQLMHTTRLNAPSPVSHHSAPTSSVLAWL